MITKLRNSPLIQRWHACFPAILIIAVVWGAAGCGNSVETTGSGSVYKAAETGDKAAVRNALNGGFDVNQPDDDGLTLLHHAAMGGQLDVVEMLLNDFSARPNPTDESGITPLDIAVELNRNDVVAVLEQEG